MPKLTDDFITKLTVPADKRDALAFDSDHRGAVRGFGVRKYRDGRASLFVKYSISGEQRRLTIGEWRRGNIDKMRDLAETVKAKAKLGDDVIGNQRAKVAEQEAAETAATVGALIEVFLAEREVMTRRVVAGKTVVPTLRPRTHEANARYLQTHCKPLHRLVVGTVTRGAQAGVVDLGKRWTPINGSKLEVVARSHVVGVIDGVAATSGKVAADRCKTALSTFYAWAIDAGFCDVNPSMNIKSRAGKVSRDRVLSDQELAAVWRACAENDFGRIVRLLLLTGQRKTEIGDLRWSEVDLDSAAINLPGARVKNGRAHIVPLSAEALVILKSLPRSDARDLVFGRGAGGFGGWTPSKKALDKRLGDMPGWVLHDLRRTLSTRANDLGLGQPHEIEACLNHAIVGVHAVYNKSRHETAKRTVLQRWGAHIAALVSARHVAKRAKAKRPAPQRERVTAA